MDNTDYCSYELAKKLYELGFDWDCEKAYFDRPWNHEHKLVYAVDATNQAAAYDGTDIYPAPTLWEAQKWLREKKEYHIEIRRMFGNIWSYYLSPLGSRAKEGDAYFKTYESALSTGISAALELIGKEELK